MLSPHCYFCSRKDCRCCYCLRHWRCCRRRQSVSQKINFTKMDKPKYIKLEVVQWIDTGCYCNFSALKWRQLKEQQQQDVFYWKVNLFGVTFFFFNKTGLLMSFKVRRRNKLCNIFSSFVTFLCLISIYKKRRKISFKSWSLLSKRWASPPTQSATVLQSTMLAKKVASRGLWSSTLRQLTTKPTAAAAAAANGVKSATAAAATEIKSAANANTSANRSIWTSKRFQSSLAAHKSNFLKPFFWQYSKLKIFKITIFKVMFI